MVWSWSFIVVCCVYDNNSIVCRFYYFIGYVCGFYGGVKKIFSFEICVSEIKNGKFWFYFIFGFVVVS